MIQMKKCLITKNPSCSLHVLVVLPEATQKKPSWARESLPAVLVHSKPCPSIPGARGAAAGSLQVAKQQWEHRCARAGALLLFSLLLPEPTRRSK